MLRRQLPLLGLRRSARLDHEACEGLRVVLLDEMSATQRRVLLALCSGDFCQETTIRATRDRIAVAEAGNERLVPAAEHLKCAAIGGGLWVFKPNRNQGR